MTDATSGSIRSTARLTPLLLVAMFFVLALAIHLSWSRLPLGVTGDEPAYLIAADGITTYGTFEQTQPIEAELRSNAIAQIWSGRTLGSMHVVHGPHGYYSIHSIGLPVLIAAPFAIAGTAGVKVLMILLGSMLVLLGWHVSGLFSRDVVVRAGTTLVVFFAMPFLTAANQIYPDLLAGLICSFAVYGLMTYDRRTAWQRLLFALPVAYLPWLHTKLAAPALILVLAAAYLARRVSTAAMAVEIAPLFFSAGLLAAYNAYAVSNIFGPYSPDALRVSEVAAGVLLGLHFDQNQGFLIQNPVFLVGVLFGPKFVAEHRLAGVVVILLFLSLIVPNAAHPNWYGGFSFSGRFAWSAATVLAIPTIYGLVSIASLSRGTFFALVAAGAALQMFYLSVYLPSGLILYRRALNDGTPLVQYSIFFGRLSGWLPAFYDRSLALRHLPNLLFPLITAGLLLVGLVLATRRRQIEGVRSP